MINFWCNTCGKTINANDKDAGKKCKCPGCGKLNNIPVTQTVNSVNKPEPIPSVTPKVSEPRPKSPPTTPVIPEVTPVQDAVSEAKTTSPPSKRAKKQRETRIGKSELIGIGIGVVAVVLVVGFILQQFLWRDTWEIDNQDAIMRIRDEAISCLESKEYESAFAKNNELLALVGDRTIRRSELIEAVSETKAVADKARHTLEGPIREMEAYAKTLADRNELEKALQTYDEILSLLHDSQTKASVFTLAISRISKSKDALAKQLSVTREAARKDEEERNRKSIPEAQAFLKTAQPFAKQAARISSLYRVGLNYKDFGKELQELSVTYDQVKKSPNALCNPVAALLDAYMEDAKLIHTNWTYVVNDSGNTMELHLRSTKRLPKDLLPKLSSRQSELADTISKLEEKIQSSN